MCDAHDAGHEKGGKMQAHYEISRGGTLIDGINRYAAATGSMRNAVASANADYNGHPVRVYWNDYRKYWVADYQWGERVVLHRGGFADCLLAAMREFNRGAKFASVSAFVDKANKVDVESCVAVGMILQSDEPSKVDPLMAEIPWAFNLQNQVGIPAVGYLANSKTLEEYKAKVDADIQRQRNARLGNLADPLIK